MQRTLQYILETLEWLLAVTAADHTGVAGYAAEVAKCAEIRASLLAGRVSGIKL